ncbi:LamG domain-containing protein [Pontiella desulfatans]|uniref:LamG domain-containing protein n=1 Tax=Pontiella desulfatans TaxID=2750659 RepID=UPI001443B20A|nr:LamG domain-containing protein [Pontiella desulfatans]
MSISFGYQVWFGLPYMPKESQSNLDQWDFMATQVKGLNLNPVDTQRPDEDRNSTADWKAIVQAMPTAKNNCMIGVPRTHFFYDGYGGSSKPTLAEMLNTKFKQEGKYACQIKWVMPFDNQPGEDRTLPIELWSDAELQELRDWLDNNGHADVKLLTNVRNNGTRAHDFAEKAIVDGMSIEAKAYLWYENNGRRQDYLQWAVANPLTKDKNFKFQVPFGTYDGESGYQAMRGFMRWLSNTVLNSTELVRRPDTVFLIITYGPSDPHLPELSADETEYVNTMSSLSLSLIEQKAMFEGTAPGGLISKAQTLSYDRAVVDSAPTSGLVAHWPLDEGSGTDAYDASGYGFDGELLNGATWGSDAERGTYAVFDGTDDRIETSFTYALADTNDFTWAWWAKKEPTSHSGSIMLGNRYGNTGSETYEFIKMTPSKASFANTDSTGSIENYDYAEIAVSSWHHYAMVKDETSYQWYVDGVAQGVASNLVYSESSPLPFLIGGDDNGSGTVNEHFEGCIDDVVLYRSALTPGEIINVINGIYLPTVTLTTLATPVDSTDGSVWSDGLPAHGGADYVIPSTGNLRGESGTTTFPGASLKVEAGGKFQVRSLESSSDVTTVNHLVLAGGAGANYALLAAGTGNNAINVLDGTITQSGASKLLTYGGSIARSLNVLSQINGDGTLQVVGEGAMIDNAANAFSGTWEVADGATLTFNNAGAVGSANIDVLDGGTLQILGTWNSGASLSVVDTPTTQVELGSQSWFVSSLLFGGSPVEGGTHTASELNALGANSVFSGTGTLTVVPEGSVYVAATYNAPGTQTWTCPQGINYIRVECWGGGGAGGGAVRTTPTGGAGGGGAAAGGYARLMNVPVTPGMNYTITIPAAATCSSGFSDGQRFNGPAVTFTGDGGATVTAAGGQGGACHIGSANGPAGIGSTTGCVGDQFYKGGSGGNYGSNNGGSGGSGPSDLANGVDGLTTETGGGGIGATGSDAAHDGGDGGDGRGAGNHGFAGSTPGGGGGGAKSQMQGGEYLGGSGGLGQIIITYLRLPADEAPMLGHGMSGGGMVFNWTGNGFKVQSCTNLTEGTWQDVPGGNMPPVTNSTVEPEAFFRLIEL